jgi:hypothetical protein
MKSPIPIAGSGSADDRRELMLATARARLISLAGAATHSLQTLVVGSAVESVRRVLPASVRSRLHRLKKWLGEKPVRLVMARPLVPSDAVRVVVYGTFANDWRPVLGDRQTWSALPAVCEVLLVSDRPGKPIGRPFYPGSRTVVIPLSEDNIRNCPDTVASLKPNRRAVDTLENKVRFAEYVEANGLADLCPVTFTNPRKAEFPCILKRAVGSYGFGTVILRSAAELDALLLRENLSEGAFVLQAVAQGTREYSTHCVCKDGRILWTCSFVCEMGGGRRSFDAATTAVP